jgi:hypothetical protein
MFSKVVWLGFVIMILILLSGDLTFSRRLKTPNYHATLATTQKKIFLCHITNRVKIFGLRKNCY